MTNCAPYIPRFKKYISKETFCKLKLLKEVLDISLPHSPLLWPENEAMYEDASNMINLYTCPPIWE